VDHVAFELNQESLLFPEDCNEDRVEKLDPALEMSKTRVGYNVDPLKLIQLMLKKKMN
jgi:hypothetical protein